MAAMINQLAIQATNLTKTFSGGVVAVNGLDLQIRRGAVYGLLGRNGAGKTTTLRLLMGLLTPDSGNVRIFGEEMSKATRSLRSRIAYVSQSLQLPGWMTLNELSRYASHFYDWWDFKFVNQLTDRWTLPSSRAVSRLSSGEQRKAAILLALAPHPEILLLDEPAAGLDPLARRELVDELVSALANDHGCTILFSTHIVSDLERIAEYVGIMDRGRLLASDRLDELQSNVRRIQIIFPGEKPPSRFSVPGALRTEISGPVVTAITRVADSEFLESLRSVPGVRVQAFPLRLEEILIEILGSGHPNEVEIAAPTVGEI